MLHKQETQPIWEAMQHQYAVVVITALIHTVDLSGKLEAFTCICFGIAWLACGIYTQSLKDVTLSEFIAGSIVTVAGGGLLGFGIPPIAHIVIEESWRPGLTWILMNLAIVASAVVILKISPKTRPLLICTTLLSASGLYSLGAGILTTVAAIGFDTIRIAAEWEKGIASILNGGAVAAWMYFIGRKAFPFNIGFAAIILMICGGSFIVLGIWRIVAALI